MLFAFMLFAFMFFVFMFYVLQRKLYDTTGAQYDPLLLDSNVCIAAFSVDGVPIPAELVVETIRAARKREVNRMSAKNVRMKAKNVKKLTAHQTAMIVHCLKRSTSLLQEEMSVLAHMIRSEIGTIKGAGSKACLASILTRCEGIQAKIPTSDLIDDLCIRVPMGSLSLN